MNIYTSYFAKAKYLDTTKYMVVSISRFSPRGWNGYEIKNFAPSADLLKAYKSGLSSGDYKKIYIARTLDKCDIRRELAQLTQYSNGRDMVLCCYESSEKFCHRHILSDYIYYKYGYRINEL